MLPFQYCVRKQTIFSWGKSWGSDNIYLTPSLFFAPHMTATTLHWPFGVVASKPKISHPGNLESQRSQAVKPKVFLYTRNWLCHGCIWGDCGQTLPTSTSDACNVSLRHSVRERNTKLKCRSIYWMLKHTFSPFKWLCACVSDLYPAGFKRPVLGPKLRVFRVFHIFCQFRPTVNVHFRKLGHCWSFPDQLHFRHFRSSKIFRWCF